MIKREIAKSIIDVNNTFRVLALTGPRQVGKTTILKNLMPKNMNIVTLDTKTLIDEAKNNPKLFLETYEKPLLIDEVQQAPELFPYIKAEVDNDTSRGQYWLSGSQTFELMNNVSESLAGRVGIIKMNSLTYKEITNEVDNVLFDPANIKESENIKANEIYEHIFKGGMPELYDIKSMDRNMFFESYINTYLERDVRQIINVTDLETFRKFLKSLAIRNGKVLNYSSIATDIGMSSITAKKWINVLTTSRIIYLLEPYYSNKIKRLTKMPKIIFVDSGLCSFLAGYSTTLELQSSEDAGFYLKTYIISELIKSYNNQGVPLDISYLRNKEKEEIDLIITKNNKLYPLEIKKTANPTRSMLKNFAFLEKEGRTIDKGGLICFFDKLLPLDDKYYYIPVSSVINAKK